MEFALYHRYLVIQVLGPLNISECLLYTEAQCWFVLFQEKRLRERKTESEENLQKRLHAAKVDMEFSKYL